MPTENLLRLLLLLMFVMRIVLATVWFGSWGLVIKLLFRLLSTLVKIFKLNLGQCSGLVKILTLVLVEMVMFG